jgi:hypothetical protein
MTHARRNVGSLTNGTIGSWFTYGVGHNQYILLLSSVTLLGKDRRASAFSYHM